MKKSVDLPSGSLFFKKAAVHSSDAVTELLTNSKDPVVDSQEPEVTALKPPSDGSTSGGCVEEVNASSVEGPKFTESVTEKLSPPNLERTDKAASPLKFTHDGNTFKFNFSVS